MAVTPRAITSHIIKGLTKGSTLEKRYSSLEKIIVLMAIEKGNTGRNMAEVISHCNLLPISQPFSTI